MKVLRKIVVLFAAISFIFAFISCDPVTSNLKTEEPVQEQPAQEEPAKEDPGKEDPAAENPAKEEPGKEDPAKEEPGKEDPEEIKKWTVTFVTNTESTVENQIIENEKKAAEPEAISKVGYTFDGWFNGDKKFDFETAITANLTLTAIWTPSTNTAYKVLHYTQNVDNDEYTLADTDNLTGTTTAQTSAETKNYEHFTAGSVTQAEIAADGSTEVKIYYTREIITYTIDLAGGTLGDSTENFTLSGRYGKSIEAVENPTRQNYKFSGWNTTDGEIPGTFETSTTYKALWTTASGISITMAPASVIKITQTETSTSITLTAEEGFTGYSWRIDGEVPEDAVDDWFAKVSDDGRSLTLKKSLYRMIINSEGLIGKSEDAYLINGEPYQISLSATKNGIPYGSQVSVTQNYIRVAIKETTETKTILNQTETFKLIEVKAESGFTDYSWTIDGKEVLPLVLLGEPAKSTVNRDGDILTLNESSFTSSETPGTKHQIILTATKDGIQYSTELLLIVEDDDASSNG